MRILKHLFYAIMLGASMAACLSQENNGQRDQPEVLDLLPEETTIKAPAPENFIIGKGHIGNIRIGTLVADMRRKVPAGMTIADTTLLAEGTAATAYIVRPQNEAKGILIEQVCAPACHVWRLTVQSPAYKTTAGIGIGSKYGEVQQAYQITQIGVGEGNVVAIAEATGVSFILDTSQLDKEKLTKLTPTDVPANTLVKGILLY